MLEMEITAAANALFVLAKKEMFLCSSSNTGQSLIEIMIQRRVELWEKDFVFLI
jgi:hypothetical protein